MKKYLKSSSRDENEAISAIDYGIFPSDAEYDVFEYDDFC